MRLLLLFAIALAGLIPGCALRQYDRNALSADGEAKIDKKLPAAQGRREAIQLAELKARDQLMKDILNKTMSDGRTVEAAAVKDAYVQAVIQDFVRASHEMPQSREVSEDKIKLTMYMDAATVNDFLRDYPKKIR